MSTQRKGRGKAKATLELIEACHKILYAQQPATVRAVCYQLFVQGLIPNMSKASTNRVSRALVYVRENGDIPWHWVVDETREAERVSTWDNPGALLRSAVAQYRRDYWRDQDYHVEVWSEKGTIRGALAPVLDELGVTFRVMHGFASATVVDDIASLSADIDKPFIALYVGDYDPSGMFMSEVDLPQRIARYGGNVHVERIALLKSDTDFLPYFCVNTKAGDRRYRWWHQQGYGAKCWELDAMQPADLRERVAFHIDRHIDSERWDRAIRVERAETRSMREFLETWHRNLGQATECQEGGAAC